MSLLVMNSPSSLRLQASTKSKKSRKYASLKLVGHQEKNWTSSVRIVYNDGCPLKLVVASSRYMSRL